MAQSRPAPAAGPVPDPGGPSWPLNGSSVAAPMRTGGPVSSPAIASQPISRMGTSLPLNTPLTQSASQMSGLGSWRVAGPVPDPGGPHIPMGPSTVGYPADPATPAGGDPRATGSSFSSGDADAPRWSQFNPTFNPNPGALSGGMESISALYPGETPASQVDITANPN